MDYQITKSKLKNKGKTKGQGFRYIIYLIIIISLAQFWFLKTYFKEIETKLPANLFTAPIKFPTSESTLMKSYYELEKVPLNDITPKGSSTSLQDKTSKTEETENSSASSVDNNESLDQLQQESYTTETTTSSLPLSEVQRKIIFRALDLLNQNIKYGYQYYPETGYPTDNIWISTDVVAMVLKDCGYDLMELIYKDMSEHKEAYPMDLKGSKNLDKYMDFRHVYFQETFFKRYALELPSEYIPGDENNNIQWQPGDIIFFQIDENNPGKDVVGIISSRKNDKGVPLVIMCTKELGKLSEVDVLEEYKIKGHYRYPYPEME